MEDKNIGIKLDSDKLEWDLLPLSMLTSTLKVLMFGKEKYSKDNWKKVKNAKIRYVNAALRHISSYQEGETTDKESNLPHLAHACCCLLFILWFDRKKTNENI
jgi:hypothetical protein